MSLHKGEPWSRESWKTKPVLQQPKYEDEAFLKYSLGRLREFPPLVHSGEIKTLKTQIAEAGRGRRFVLQAGDCAERFVDCTQKSITDKLKIILQMSLILTYGMRKPVVRIGRIAGQYAKPRSDDTETIDGVTLPSFRGDIINGFAFEAEARRPDPDRLVRAYVRSGLTLNYLRSLIDGGFADVRHPELWKLDHISETFQPKLYTEISARVRESTNFMDMLLGGASPETLRRVEFFTSHEALLLDYESALTYHVESENAWYNLGAHFVWLGERTRQLNGAHTEYLRGIANPIGIKVGPNADPDEIIALVRQLNPTDEPGKITLITRMGASKIEEKMPPLVERIKNSGIFVTWSADPMHGNVIKTEGGIKTRDFGAILSELKLANAVHKKMGTILGGVHFELTGDNVTECLGGEQGLAEKHLSENYQSYCDPRLNYSQSMEIAYLISEHL